MRVHVAIFSHKHGQDVSVFADAQGAEQARRDIAADWWDKEVKNREPKPKDEKELADRYYAITGETYSVYDCNVVPRRRAR